MVEHSELMNVLGIGEQNRLSRQALVVWLHISDRALRKEIEYLQIRGVPIINISNGYFICEDRNEMMQYVRREQARARTIESKCADLTLSDWFDK